MMNNKMTVQAKMPEIAKILANVFYLIIIAAVFFVISTSAIASAEPAPWWDTSYPYRYTIYQNTTNSYPVFINDTFGINGGPVLAFLKNDSYIYSTSSSVTGTIAVANNTAQKFWENETSGIGNNVEQLWADSVVDSRYGFGEGSGMKAHDSTSINNITMIGGANWSSGKFGNGQFFNSSMIANASTVGLPVGSGDRTISFWMKTSMEITADYVPLITYGTEASGRDSSISIQKSTLQGSLYIIGYGGAYDVPTSIVVNDGIWHYVAVTYNGSVVSVYVDNQTPAVKTVTWNTTSNGRLQIGGVYGTTLYSGGNFSGWIDEVRVYNRSINQQEVSVNYYQGINNYTKLGAEEARPNIAPTITLSSPADLSWSASRTINYQFTPLTDDSFSDCSVWTNATGSWALTQANTSAITNNSTNTISTTHEADGNILWAVQCTDNATTPLSNFSTTNRTIMIDSITPAVTIQAPANNAILNYMPHIIGTVTEANLAFIKTNDTHYEAFDSTSPFNFSNTSAVPEGRHTINISANDSAGNVGWANITFTYDTTQPSITSHSPASGAVGVSTSTTINLTFSEDMDQTTFSGILLRDSNGTDIPMALQSYSIVTYAAIFAPSETLRNNMEYTVTLAGLKDVAGNVLPNSSWSFTTSTSYNITLSKKGTNGWNLISLPVTPANKSIESVLSNVITSIENVWTYNSITGNWSMYAPNNPSSDLNEMAAGYGYWINYSSDTPMAITGLGSIYLEGANVPPSIALKEGWNLIGYYQKGNTNEVQSKCALSMLTPNINDWTMAWWQTPVVGYDNTGKIFTEVYYNDLMAPGQGYWIFMKSTHMYAPGIGAKNASTTDCI